MNLFLKREARRPEFPWHNPYLAPAANGTSATEISSRVPRTGARWRHCVHSSRWWRRLGMVWLSARSHVVPFVVLVDNLGRPVASGVADQTSLNDDRLEAIEHLQLGRKPADSHD